MAAKKPESQPPGSMPPIGTSQHTTAPANVNGEACFETLVKGMVDVIWSADLNFSITYLTPQFKNMFGFEPVETIGTSLFSFAHPNDHDLVEKTIKNLGTNNPADTIEFRHRCDDECYIWVMLSATMTFDEHENATGLQGTIRDIGDRKAMESALTESEAKYRQLVEDSKDVTWSSEIDGTVTYVSEQLRKMFGYSPADSIGKSFIEFVHPDDRATASATLLEVQKYKKTLTHEFRFKCLDGSYTWALSTTKAIPHAKENKIRFHGVIRDINDHKTAVMALDSARDQFHRIAENVPGMIYRYTLRTDGSHAILYAGPQCRELLELEPEEVMADFDKVMQRYDPKDVERIREYRNKSAKNLSQFRAEYRVTLPIKGLCWRQSISQPLRKDNGDIVWDGIITDITERKNTELQLQRLNAQLATATKMKDEFLATMSHELRTPLTAILGMSEGLQQGMFGPVTDDQASSFRVIQESGDHLLELINEVLDLAKVESGSLELVLSNIEIHELCGSCIQLVFQQAKKKNIKLNLKSPIDLPTLEADVKRVRQILVNLLSNAVKFTHDGGEVTLTAQRIAAPDSTTEEHIRFSVEDNGIGMDETKMQTLFEPFAQVQTSLNRDYAGIGLGLALVKRFTELLSGKVSVHTEVGVGTCFYVDLPFKQTANVLVESASGEYPFEQKNTEQSSSQLTQKKRGRKIRILLAEDNDSVALATTRYLELSNYRVHRVIDGEEAVSAAKEHSPDIILMDIQMPKVDGLEATKRLRKNSATEQTPIIALTGLAMEDDSSRCLSAGADDYLSKPFRMQNLVKLIEDLLARETIDVT